MTARPLATFEPLGETGPSLAELSARPRVHRAVDLWPELLQELLELFGWATDRKPHARRLPF